MAPKAEHFSRRILNIFVSIVFDLEEKLRFDVMDEILSEM